MITISLDLITFVNPLLWLSVKDNDEGEKDKDKDDIYNDDDDIDNDAV